MPTFRRAMADSEWHFLSTCRSWPTENYEFVYRSLADEAPPSVCPRCVVSAPDLVKSWPGFNCRCRED